METNETNLPTSDISLDTYDRYCRQIDKEDDLINQRINWLLVSQSILFAALGISNRTILDVTLEVALVGIGVSVGISNEADVAVTVTEGEVPDGTISALGVKVLVGVNIGKVTDMAGDSDRAASVVVDGDEAAGA